MMDEERIAAFVQSLDEGNSGILAEIEQEARRDRIPIIRPQMQSLLRLLLTVKRPVSILEVGTAVGFSTLFMQLHNPVPCRIVTIENYQKRIPLARSNFQRAGAENDICLLCGDALEVLPTLSGPFDFIFLDAAKGQYLYFLPHLLRLLAEDGMLVSDNVLQEGDILESRFAVTRRNRTIHKRMRQYLYELTHHPGLITSVLPVADGVTVSCRRETQ